MTKCGVRTAVVSRAAAGVKAPKFCEVDPREFLRISGRKGGPISEAAQCTVFASRLRARPSMT